MMMIFDTTGASVHKNLCLRRDVYKRQTLYHKQTISQAKQREKIAPPVTFSPIYAKIFPVCVPYTGFRPQYIKEEKIMHPKNNRSSFSGKIGFVLSAAGASVGLGNIWRFPYLAAKYGEMCIRDSSKAMPPFRLCLIL